jgi:hypothetical protein
MMSALGRPFCYRRDSTRISASIVFKDRADAAALLLASFRGVAYQICMHRLNTAASSATPGSLAMPAAIFRAPSFGMRFAIAEGSSAAGRLNWHPPNRDDLSIPHFLRRSL